LEISDGNALSETACGYFPAETTRTTGHFGKNFPQEFAIATTVKGLEILSATQSELDEYGQNSRKW
jgi:hypothetical protein